MAWQKVRVTPGIGVSKALHPWEGETEPEYTDFQDDGKYSWVKAPTFFTACVPK